MSDFLKALDDHIIIGDGAMGTQIYARGVPLDRSYEELNLTDPHLIKMIHREYRDAGAEFFETNTFQANRIKLKKFGLDAKVRDINIAGARLAREIAGKNAFVGGSIGPLTGIKSNHELSEQEIFDAFAEQCKALEDGGCDVLIFETFINLDELLTGLRAARATKLPVICQMSFHEDRRTPTGVSVDKAIAELDKAGADVIGVNCSLGPHWALKAIERMGQLTKTRLAVFPNAGIPQYREGRYLYLTTPEYFAQMGKKLVAAGANLVGGCCGTDASHIRALATKLKNARPMPRLAALPKRLKAEVIEKPKKPRRPKTFFDKIGKEPLIVVELDPPRHLSLSKTIEGARGLRDAGVDAITVGDNPLAVVRMGNLAVSHLFEKEGINTITHLSCRDRNLIALQSYIMEAHVLGLTSLLAITGDPARVGDQPQATSVYDLNSIGLIKMIKGFNDGKNFQGAPLKKATNFIIGCAFNPNKTKDDEMQRLRKKIEAGAQFALCQPCYDAQQIETVWTKLNKEFPGFPVFYGFLPPLSARNAEFLANEVPGITIPQDVIDRIKAAPEDKQTEEGLKITRELIDVALRYTSCFYMILPFNRTDIGVEFVRLIKKKKLAAVQSRNG